jgi:hypothetical protein
MGDVSCASLVRPLVWDEVTDAVVRGRLSSMGAGVQISKREAKDFDF